ncbi:MAG: M48 family metalloprotease [Verrucomicrobiales bacterium]|nr:M48 family metalloprotease [Verrucomicrobiales bacterium]
MSRDDFDALVKRLEEISQRNPSGYVVRVVSLVLLAYGYLGLVLLLCIALTLGTLYVIVTFHNAAAIKLGIAGILIFGGLAWAVIRGLWVRFEKPEGIPISREQAPRLFEMLDHLRNTLQCSSFHEVLAVNDYNAAVMQIPRLGVFGWHRNYLLLGLPLLQSLSPDEFKAVLAHEFAHSSKGHGRFGNWLYRVRRSWERIFDHMASREVSGAGVLRVFVRWFWPVFNAHAFVLSRVNEYEADACSVRLAGAQSAASALMRLPVDASLLTEKFWPSLYTKANDLNTPPSDMAQSIRQTIAAGPSPEDAAKWLRQAFLAETNNSDTHPCLKDRLRAIGSLPEGIEQGIFPQSAPPRSGPSAAETFLGAHEAVLETAISQEWQKLVEPGWKERHAEVQKASEELATLETVASTEAADTEILWKKANKLIQLHDDSVALPVVEQILARNPEHASANFVYGRHHLEKDDPAGITYMETAMKQDPTVTPEACNALYAHFTRTGQRDQLRPLEERMDQFQEESQKAQVERSNVKESDTFEPADLTAAQLQSVQSILESEADIGSAAVAKKKVSHFPTSACYVIAVRLRISQWKFRSEEANQKLAARVAEKIELPGHFLVFIDEKELKAVAKKVFAVPQNPVYTRPKLK